VWLQRRLLIGVVLTAAALAFALVPTDSLRIVKPLKPLFFYLVPLIRVQARRPTQTSHSARTAQGAALNGHHLPASHCLRSVAGGPLSCEQTQRMSVHLSGRALPLAPSRPTPRSRHVCACMHPVHGAGAQRGQ